MTTSPENGAESTEPEAPTEVPVASDTPDTPAGSATPARRSNKGLVVAAAVGVVGLLVGGGAGYLVGHDGSDGSGGSADASGSSAQLTLPSSLAGGFQRSSQVDSQIKPSVTSAQSALGAGTDMALYTHGKTQLLVEATRLPGEALLQAGMQYSKVGDAVCGTGSSSSGTEAVCSRSSGDLTVKVTAATAPVAAKYADEAFSALA